MELIDTNSPRACPRRIGDMKRSRKHCLVLKVQPSEKRKESGGNGIEDPPVPIPNTEVKLNCVDGTWRVTARESRTLPDYFFLRNEYSSIAQLAEHLTVNQRVTGSSPVGRARTKDTNRCLFLLLFYLVSTFYGLKY